MDIYQLTNVVNGKIYIGKASDLKARLYMHSRAYDHKRSSLHRAIRKHGWSSFSIQILSSGIEDEETLNIYEKYWIAVKNATDRSVGYNLTAGGEGTLGWKASDETRAKWSAMRKGKVPAPHVLEALHRKAKNPKSEETKRRMAESAKRRSADPAYCAMMSAATLGKQKSESHKAALRDAAKRRARNNGRFE